MMNDKILACICAAVSATVFVSGGEPVSTELIKQRGLVSQGDPARLQAVFAKARRGEPICVAAIGGSITAGGLATKDPANRYVNRIAAWFTRTFPKAKVRFVNAGIGGTNSYYGSMRLQEDVLSQKPDLVVVEYAVNNMSDREFSESYEGLLRQLLREPQKIAVIELFFMHRKGENAQEWQEMLGRHYGLPMVSFRDAWWPELSSGRAVWEEMYADVVHPNDTGHILASELLLALLEQVNGKLALGTALTASGTVLPSPMISDLFTECMLFQNKTLKATESKGWRQSSDGRCWEASEPGSLVRFTFQGRLLFMGFDMDKGIESRVRFSIDGGAAQELKPDVHRRPIARNLAAGTHSACIELTGVPVPTNAVGTIRVWGVGGAGCQR